MRKREPHHGIMMADQTASRGEVSKSPKTIGKSLGHVHTGMVLEIRISAKNPL